MANTGRRPPLPPSQAREVQEYVRSFDPRLMDQPITREMPVLQQPQPQQVAFYPVERKTCGEGHGCVVARLDEHERRLTSNDAAHDKMWRVFSDHGRQLAAAKPVWTMLAAIGAAVAATLIGRYFELTEIAARAIGWQEVAMIESLKSWKTALVLLLSAALAAAIAWQATGDWVSSLISGLASLLGVGVAGASKLPPSGGSVVTP